MNEIPNQQETRALWRPLCFFLGSTLLATLCVGIVWVRMATVISTHKYIKLSRKYRKVQSEYQEKKVDWLRASSPERLVRMAESLNLATPSVEQLKTIKKSQGESH